MRTWPSKSVCSWRPAMETTCLPAAGTLPVQISISYTRVVETLHSRTAPFYSSAEKHVSREMGVSCVTLQLSSSKQWLLSISSALSHARVLIAFPPSNTEFVEGFQVYLHRQGKSSFDQTWIFKPQITLCAKNGLFCLKKCILRWPPWKETALHFLEKEQHFSPWLFPTVLEILNYAHGGRCQAGSLTKASGCLCSHHLKASPMKSAR